MQLLLRIQEPGQPAREVQVVAGMTFGRASENDCVLDDTKVSGRHARIVELEGAFRIEDLGSSNGTQIVGGPNLGEGEGHPLAPGTRIEIGFTRVFVTRPVASERTMMLDRDALSADLLDDPASDSSESPTTSHHMADFDLVIEDTSSAKSTFSDLGPAVGDGLDDDPDDGDESTILSPPSSNPEASTLVSDPAPKTTGEVARRHDVIDESAFEATVVSSRKKPEGNEDSTIRRPSPTTTAESAHGGAVAAQSSVSEVVTAMAARLAFGDPEVRALVLVESIPFTIGRAGSENEPDCPIDHSTVSTRHAQIKLSQRRFFLEDSGSKNGTFIDGRAIPVMASRELSPDSAIRFGGVDALFVVDRGPELVRLDRANHPAAIKHLAREGMISRRHGDEALAVHERGEHAGQYLVMGAGLEPHRWGDAVRFVTAHPRRSTETFGVLMIVLLVIVVAAVAYVVFDFLR